MYGHFSRVVCRPVTAVLSPTTQAVPAVQDTTTLRQYCGGDEALYRCCRSAFGTTSANIVLQRLQISELEFSRQSIATQRLLLLDAVAAATNRTLLPQPSYNSGTLQSVPPRGPHHIIDAVDVDDNGHSDAAQEAVEEEANRRYQLLVERGRQLLRSYRGEA